jgi:RIO kinase 1
MDEGTKRTNDSIDSTRVDDMLAQERFEPRFSGRYREHVWIRDSLGGFWQDKLFTDVLYRVKAGKEATVYCLQGGPPVSGKLIAGKIYRPRMFRTMRNDKLYRQGTETKDVSGKAVRDRRSRLAMRKRTRFGKQLLAASWNMNEYQMLRDFHSAGADVPEPIAHGPSAILMEYLGDETQAAPILHGLRLDKQEARAVLDRLLWNVELFLSLDRIHADLSAYNVLYWQGRATIIDLPQAVRAETHPEAFALLSRDVTRLCQWAASQDVNVNATRIACDLWERYSAGQL